MQEIKQVIIIVRDETRPQPQSQPMPHWMLFLLCLATLRVRQPEQPPEVKTLRTLIIVVGLVLTVVALVAAGAPEEVAEVLRHWPSIP